MKKRYEVDLRFRVELLDEDLDSGITSSMDDYINDIRKLVDHTVYEAKVVRRARTEEEEE